MSLRIDLKESVQSNTERMLQVFLDDCRTSLQNEDPHKAIHESRKTMKKIRAFCRLMRGEIGSKTYRKSNTFYRDVARQLSDARDITAMLDTLQHHQEDLDTPLSGQAFQDIKNHLTSRKAAVSRIQINKDKLLENVQEDLKKAEAIHAKWKVKHDDFSAFAKGIQKTYAQCQDAMKEALKKKSTKSFHEWRKRCKYLRYEIDFLREIWPEPMKTLEKELHQLTDYLGDDHDLAVLKTYIKSMPLEKNEAIAAMFALFDQKRKELQAQAKPLGKRILCESPDQFVSRLGSYWKHALKAPEVKENPSSLTID